MTLSGGVKGGAEKVNFNIVLIPLLVDDPLRACQCKFDTIIANAVLIPLLVDDPLRASTK